MGWAVSCVCSVAAAGKLCAVCLLGCAVEAGVAGAETVCQTHINDTTFTGKCSMTHDVTKAYVFIFAATKSSSRLK